MSKYMFTAHYSSGSWARLVRNYDDRTIALRSLIESLGGTLEALYWAAHSLAAHAIAELPDSISAKAVVTTTVETGAFTSVEAQELLSEEQLHDTLLLSRSAAEFYQAPGKSAIEAAY